jgi:hypothetical protein
MVGNIQIIFRAVLKFESGPYTGYACTLSFLPFLLSVFLKIGSHGFAQDWPQTMIHVTGITGM